MKKIRPPPPRGPALAPLALSALLLPLAALAAEPVELAQYYPTSPATPTTPTTPGNSSSSGGTATQQPGTPEEQGAGSREAEDEMDHDVEEQEGPTNTGINQRDRNDRTMTPENQPNDSSDIDLLARVRKAVVGDDTLSSLAHNIKITATRGMVLLRGPVQNAGEKQRVERLVKAVSGVRSVKNELDIRR